VMIKLQWFAIGFLSCFAAISIVFYTLDISNRLEKMEGHLYTINFGLSFLPLDKPIYPSMYTGFDD